MRPRFGPVPGSLSVQLNVRPDALIAAVDSEVTRVGLVVERAAPDEGYLETRWYDVATQRTVGERARDLANVVKLRFFADPTAGHTHLAAECVVRLMDDPSEPSRYWERMAADSTPGRVLLDSIVAHLTARFPLPTAAPAGTTPRP